MEEFVLYILRSKRADKIYIGYTSNLISRFHSHNSFIKKVYTIRYRPWEVIHVEFFYGQKKRNDEGQIFKVWDGPKIYLRYCDREVIEDSYPPEADFEFKSRSRYE